MPRNCGYGIRTAPDQVQPASLTSLRTQVLTGYSLDFHLIGRLVGRQLETDWFRDYLACPPEELPEASPRRAQEFPHAARQKSTHLLPREIVFENHAMFERARVT